MSRNKKFFLFILPLVGFFILGFLFQQGLKLDPHALPSTLINQPAPTFQAPDLYNTKMLYNNKLFEGHLTLLNIFASWCSSCRIEHPFLMGKIKNSGITLIGLDYKDNAEEAKAYLKEFGNPYQHVLFDPQGNVGINWGVYGTPETFLIDGKGIVRYRQLGLIDEKTWQQIFLPLIKKLNSKEVNN